MRLTLSDHLLQIPAFFARFSKSGLQVVFSTRKVDQSVSASVSVQEAIEKGLESCKKILQFVSISEADLSGPYSAIGRGIRAATRCWAVQLNNCSVGEDFLQRVLGSMHVDFVELRTCSLSQKAAEHLVAAIDTGCISILVVSQVSVESSFLSAAASARRQGKRQRGEGEGHFFREIFAAARRLEALRVLCTAADAAALAAPEALAALLETIRDPSSKLRHLAIDGDLKGLPETFHEALWEAACRSPALMTYTVGTHRWRLDVERGAGALAGRPGDEDASAGSSGEGSDAGPRPARRGGPCAAPSASASDSEAAPSPPPAPADAAVPKGARRQKGEEAQREPREEDEEEETAREETAREAVKPEPEPESEPGAEAEAEARRGGEDANAHADCHAECLCCLRRGGGSGDFERPEGDLGYRVIQVRRHPDCPPQLPGAHSARLTIGPEDGWEDVRARAALLLGLPAVSELWSLDFVKVERLEQLRHRWPYVCADLTGPNFALAASPLASPAPAPLVSGF
eukprot:tig00021168_g19075.t1